MVYTKTMQDDHITAIASYINKHPLAVLSTVDAQGDPHGTTLYAGSDNNLSVYFTTKTKTQKYQNISQHPTVALTFSGEDHQTTLQLSGEAVEVTTPVEGDAAFQVLASIGHESEDFRLPISKIEAGTYATFRVNVSYAVLTQYEQANRVDGVVKIEYKR
jgi:uncharacterized pyridoxamine 5'-phosphate oxidase family protein